MLPIVKKIPESKTHIYRLSLFEANDFKDFNFGIKLVILQLKQIQYENKNFSDSFSEFFYNTNRTAQRSSRDL
jgi:hypothetical protein